MQFYIQLTNSSVWPHLESDNDDWMLLKASHNNSNNLDGSLMGGKMVLSRL